MVLVSTHHMRSILLGTNTAAQWLGLSGVSIAMVRGYYLGNFDVGRVDDNYRDNDDNDIPNPLHIIYGNTVTNFWKKKRNIVRPTNRQGEYTRAICLWKKMEWLFCNYGIYVQLQLMVILVILVDCCKLVILMVTFRNLEHK